MRTLVLMSLAAVAAAVTFTGGQVLHRSGDAPDDVADAPRERTGSVAGTGIGTAPRSPFEVSAERARGSASGGGGVEREPSLPDEGALSTKALSTRTLSTKGPATRASSAEASVPAQVDAASVAVGSWSDDDFLEHVALLRADPAALALVIEEFRAESDPVRLTRLASLLGEVGAPQLAAVGEQMVHSGNEVSRDAGLALLRHLQPDSEDARETIIGLLSSETEPAVLMSVLDAVSVPGAAGADQMDTLINQLIPLARHPSVGVRHHSITVLSRWGADENITPVLQAGLTDADRRIRNSAAYAFVDYPLIDTGVRQDLFSLLENTGESRSVRSAALLALERAELDAQDAARLRAAKKRLHRRRSPGAE